MNGPNAKFTSVNQFWPSRSRQADHTHFAVTIGTSNLLKLTVAFRWDKKRFDVDYNTYTFRNSALTVRTNSPVSEIVSKLLDMVQRDTDPGELRLVMQEVNSLRNRNPEGTLLCRNGSFHRKAGFEPRSFPLPVGFVTAKHCIRGNASSDHGSRTLAWTRGNPERTYPVAAVGPTFPGTFKSYVASLIAEWATNSPDKIKGLGDDLKELGLTWKVEAKRLDDTRVELQVGAHASAKAGGK